MNQENLKDFVERVRGDWIKNQTGRYFMVQYHRGFDKKPLTLKVDAKNGLYEVLNDKDL